MKKIYVDRSRTISYQRCKRQRYTEYHAGSAKVGLVPKRKSIHLVIGGAAHAGLESLLLSAMLAGSDWKQVEPRLQEVEDLAVEAALADLTEAMKYGVELDTIEQPDPDKKDQTSPVDKPPASPYQSGESPIILDFDLGVIDGPTTGPITQLGLPSSPDPTADFAAPRLQSSAQPSPSLDLSDEETAALNQEISAQANAAAAAGVDEYLKKELAALVEGMTRAYARRRLQPLLEEFEILEVEREGTWRLAAWDEEERYDMGDPRCMACNGPKVYHAVNHPEFTLPRDQNYSSETCHEICDLTQDQVVTYSAREIWWMSRHDALLRERSTDFLYLLSFKTTGSWDRRKKQDAEIDMQGLSEAVDVENRMAEAWELLHIGSASEKVSERVSEWLLTQSSPPKIYAVRYEYLLKGARREEKDTNPKRYVQDSPLIRAYRQDGITLADRRWAANYKWHDLAGGGHTLSWKHWKKSNIWEFIPIADWIDLLASGEIQPDTYDESGNPVDVLADQFIPPISVFRKEDDMRDWLEQIEAQEIQVAIDVARVQAAKDEGERRSLLNRLFPQTRQACVYPGKCGAYEICYGGEDIRRDPEHHSELYQIRTANHPVEMELAAAEEVR